MKIVAVANMKGGVGKTTVTVSLADGLAHVFGLRILVIDLDMQCNASQVIWGSLRPLPWRGEDNIKGFLTRWLADETHDCALDIKTQVIRHGGPGRSPGWVSLFSGSNDLRMLERNWLSRISPYDKCVGVVQTALDAILDRVRSLYDVILVDCPPGISMLTEAVLIKSDMLLVPTAPTRFGIEGQNSYIEFISALVPATRPQILLSMLNKTKVSEDFVGAIREKAVEPGCRFDLLKSHYPERVAFEAAMGYANNTPFDSKYGTVAANVMSAARTIATTLRIHRNEPEQSIA